MEKDVLAGMEAAQRTSYEVSRRKALGIVTKLGLGGAAAAALGAGVGTRSVREALAQNGLPQKDYKITFVNHVTTNPFFTPTIYGIEDACAFLGCEYQWTGSETSDVAQMVSAMQTAIANKVDGIAVCLVDAEAFNQPTEDALSIGIPVIGYNADTEGNARLSYVGQSLYQSGYNIAQKWLPMVKPGGHVMLSIATPGSLNLQPRLDGYIQAIKDAGDPVTYETLESGVDQATEESRIESYYLANTDVAGMFGTGATDSLAVGKISKKYGLAATGVITAGYDLLPETLALIGSGDMTFTTDQQPYLQGFLPTLQIYLYKLSGGAVSPANTDTSLAYVTKDNVDIYLSPSRFEGSTEDEPV
ncbi:MAG TPA: sugar ABC transporter substrate-binding protein [Thermomicrobiales bacterium]|nr:sugar ABC transporter substrate-binding protein [Thermomicrobiales bacterium]